MNMLISIGDEHDGHFGIGNRPNNGNMMVNIMRHSSVLLLECIIIMFQKFVDKIDPIITNEAAKQNTGNYNIHITNSNNNQQRFIEALNYKYEKNISIWPEGSDGSYVSWESFNMGVKDPT